MRARLFLAGALLLACAPGCRRREPPATARGASLFLISIDTLRSDRLPVYGYAKLAAPHFSGFAADSVTFERAYSHYPLTLPSHASLFTGLLPPQHGVRDNKGYLLADEHLTLAERLKQSGYRTHAVVSSMVLARVTGIAQGFDEFDDRMEDPEHPDLRRFPQRPGSVSLALAKRLIEQASGRDKQFVFLHLFEPHTPRNAPEPYASRYHDAYDAEVAYADSLLGEFLAFLKERGLYDPSLIVVLSDHGEGLGDHVEQEHGLTLYRETLQVPLLVKLPGQQRRGQRVGVPVGLIDVAPTLLALLGLDHAGLEGSALFEAAAPAPDRPLYAETWFTYHQYGWSELRSILAGGAHYIEAPRPELYDIEADPRETHNRLPQASVPAALSEALARVGAGTRSTREVPREELEQLEALGYVGGAASQPPAGARPDPKDHIAEVMEMWSLMEQVGKTESLEAERRIAEILKSLGLRKEPLARTIAVNLLRAGRLQAARDVLEPFDASPDPETQVLLGEVATAQGRFPEADGRFRKALGEDPRGRARMGLGILLLSQGRAREARGWLEQALAANERLPEAWNALGVVRVQTGDTAGAISAWQRAVELDSGLSDAWFNLALGLAGRGDKPAAIRALERYLPLAKGADRSKAEALMAKLHG